MVYQWINYHYNNELEYYKEYQNHQNCKEKNFPRQTQKKQPCLAAKACQLK